MALTPGSRLGPYEVISALGAGGMGEVYKARDTRLDRTVAIKVLPDALAADPQLRDRFDREARTISSLNHPHICTLFDVGHQDGVDFLVLEYLEGETVAERLSSGAGGASAAFAVRDALTIAIDICDALDKAHRSGIVHRDLKPANVMLVRSGGAAPPMAKLLDFGLAKSAAPVVASSGLSMLPTTPANLTAQGTILGTFQYMAPEQIEGLEADARTDVFAVGALLFEMLTGRPAFEGKTRTSLLGAILKDEPPAVSRVQPVAPAALDRMVSTCLAKDPDDRYQSARDLLRDLKWIASGSSEGVAAVVASPARSGRVGWLVAALSVVALIATGVVALRSRSVTATREPVRFTIAPPENTYFGGPAGPGTGIATQLALSPDGRHIVFVLGGRSGYQLWLRPLATLAATPISGTEGGTFPFWSPDSKTIGFFAGGKLKRVQLTGGPAIPLCDAPAGRGGSWNRDNVILFAATVNAVSQNVASPGGSILRVSSAGGTPTVVTTPDPATGETFRWPHFLPDGRHFIYTAPTGSCCPAAKPSAVRIGSLDSADVGTTLFHAESAISYASGHLLYLRDDTLVAHPFDPDARQFIGDAFPVAENVSHDGNRYISASVSENGTLVYGYGNSLSGLQLTWFDRAGSTVNTLSEPAPYTGVALSPDGRRAAVALGTGSPENIDIFTVDVASGLRQRLNTDSGTERAPVWSPDGTRVAFGSEQAGKAVLRQKSKDGSTEELLLESVGTPSRPCGVLQCFIWPSDWNGKFLAYTLVGTFPATSQVWILPLSGDRKPFRLDQTDFIEASGRFSPDGRWIAYSSDDEGPRNIYVRPFPGTGERHRVSPDGGSNPAWGADGKELFYVGADATMMAVPIETTGEFVVGMPKALFPTRAPVTNNGRFDQMYAVTKDGTRFLVTARSGDSAAPLTVVLNWTAAIQK